MALRAEGYLANDPGLTNLWQKISVLTSIETTPPGAEVWLSEYGAGEPAARFLGTTPLNQLRLARGLYRWQLKKAGYDPLEFANVAVYGPVRHVLSTAGGVPPGMVRAQGGKIVPLIVGLDAVEPVDLEDYAIDKFEVTNEQFTQFVDAGGYRMTNVWRQPFLKAGRALSWSEATAGFRDRTGQPGPATWSDGMYPPGTADHPVGGVSWYEAAAYAEFAGKRLPTVFHWNNAAVIWSGVAQQIALSNFGKQGPAAVGHYRGMSLSGAFDMAGNVKEWCWNENEPGKRCALGGAWDEPSYIFLDLDAADPFDRSPTRGFRCMRSLSPSGPSPTTLGRIVPAFRDYKQERPVADEIFRIYKGLYAYDRTPLNSVVEPVEDGSALWRRERIRFNAAYGNERMTAHLFLPRKVAPPLQTVVFVPGSGVLHAGSSETNLAHLSYVKLAVQSGRAVLYPVFKGTYERAIGLTWTKQTSTTPSMLSSRPISARDFVVPL